MESYHAVDEEQVCSTRPCSQATVRVDKGSTEAYTDSKEERHGQGFLGTSSLRRATTGKSRDGGPTSMDGSLCNCTIVAIGEGTGIGCEETTTHSPITWSCITRFCRRHPRATRMSQVPAPVVRKHSFRGMTFSQHKELEHGCGREAAVNTGCSSGGCRDWTIRPSDIGSDACASRPTAGRGSRALR